MTFVRTVIGVLAGLFAVATLVAQTPAPQQNPPTFRDSVQLIDVDVIVTDREGKPVRGLTADDFEIIEEDRPQQIRTFSVIDLPIEAPRRRDARQPREPERDVVTNTSPEGRTYVLLVDMQGESQQSVLRARHLAERWVDEVVQPSDRVAVIHVGGTYSQGQGFTSSRHLILNSINYMVNQTPDDAPAMNENIPYATVALIKDLAQRLGTIAGRRKAIIWLGGDPPLHPLWGSLTRASEMMLPLKEWREATETAVNNNVAIYPIDPDGLTTEFGVAVLAKQMSLREVAEDTGAVAIGVNTNNFEAGFTTILQDASTYYLLGYTPDPERTDGKFHPIRVHVKRSDVIVRARRGYYARALDSQPARPLPMPPDGVSLSARDALRRPVAVPGLGIDVSTSAFKSDGDDASVVIAAHVRPQMLSLDEGRQIAVSYQVFDLEGKVATGSYKVFGMKLESDTRARATSRGLQFVERVTLKPGRYELRLVADQPGGAMGSVVTHIDARKFENELALSGVTLAPRQPGEVVLVGDTTIRSALTVDPTARRTFRAADDLAVYAEVYTKLDDRARKQFRSTDNAELTATITTGADEVVGGRHGQRVIAEPVGNMLREGFRVDAGIAGLAPGQYVLTVEGRSTRDPKRPPVTRQIPFEIVR